MVKSFDQVAAEMRARLAEIERERESGRPPITAEQVAIELHHRGVAERAEGQRRAEAERAARARTETEARCRAKYVAAGGTAEGWDRDGQAIVDEAIRRAALDG